MIIYPTHYEGGEFVFRYEGREWKFDANSLTASRPSPSLAYIAFRTDVEHEVLTVTSGHRITLTYKLYLDDPALESGAPAVIPNTSTRSDFRTTLYDLLESPEFFPEGGTLGFGLVCPYTLTFPMDLKKLAKDLKGEDAQVYQTCRDLELQTSLRMIYDDSESRKFGIMLDRVVREPLYDVGGIFGSDVADSYEAALVKDDGGVPVNKLENANLGDCTRVSEDSEGEFITWIFPFNRQNRLQDVNISSISHKFEVSWGYTYCSPCIIVRVPHASDRM